MREGSFSMAGLPAEGTVLWLASLHEVKWSGPPQTARILGLPQRAVRERLDRYRIQLHSTDWNRGDHQMVPAEVPDGPATRLGLATARSAAQLTAAVAEARDAARVSPGIPVWQRLPVPVPLATPLPRGPAPGLRRHADSHRAARRPADCGYAPAYAPGRRLANTPRLVTRLPSRATPAWCAGRTARFTAARRPPWPAQEKTGDS